MTLASLHLHAESDVEAEPTRDKAFKQIMSAISSVTNNVDVPEEDVKTEEDARALIDQAKRKLMSDPKFKANLRAMVAGGVERALGS